MSDDTILVSVPIPVVGGLAEDGLDDVDRLLLECGATLVRESGPIGRSAPPSKIVCVYAKKLQRLGPCPIPHMAAGVYFVRAGGFIKIGVSKDVRARLQKIDTASPIAPVLALLEPGGPAEERQFHERFADLRARREWFHARGALAEFIIKRRLEAA